MTVQYASAAAIAMVSVIIQTTLFPFVSNAMFVDLLFVLVVIIGLFKDPVHGAIMTFALGYLADLAGSEVRGFHMTAYLSVFLIAQTIKDKVSPDTAGAQFTIGAGLATIYILVKVLLHEVFTETEVFSVMVRGVSLILAGIVVNAAMVPLFYMIFRKVPGFMEVPKGPSIRR